MCHQIIRVDLWALWASDFDKEELDVGGGKKEKSSYFAASVSIKAANQESGVTCSVIPVINRRNIPLIVLFPLWTNL